MNAPGRYISLSVWLNIPFEKLASLLARAEQMHQAREPEGGRQSVKSQRQTRKHKASSSPVDELISEDEARYQVKERDVAERASAGDKDFQLLAAKR